MVFITLTINSWRAGSKFWSSFGPFYRASAKYRRLKKSAITNGYIAPMKLDRPKCTFVYNRVYSFNERRGSLERSFDRARARAHKRTNKESYVRGSERGRNVPFLINIMFSSRLVEPSSVQAFRASRTLVIHVKTRHTLIVYDESVRNTFVATL